MNKSKLLQVRIQQLIDYVLHNTTKGRSGPYSQAELAEELKVPRSLITHIVKGRRTLKLSKLERLEELTGMEVFTIQNPELFGKTTLKHLTEEKVNLEVRTLMKSKFNGLEFYEDLLKAIRSQFEVDYPDVFIEERINSQQYVSLNIYGNIIREKLQKNNLHLLFFKYHSTFKIEFMISVDYLLGYISKEPWFNNFLKSYKPDKCSVTDFKIDPESPPNRKGVVQSRRPVYSNITSLTKSEMESLATLSLAIFEIQCGLREQ